jgi:hypothetical protein
MSVIKALMPPADRLREASLQSTFADSARRKPVPRSITWRAAPKSVSRR